MTRHAVPCSFALLAMLAAAAPSEPAPECPKGGSEVVVKAVRFSEGPPSYSFMVTNNATRPIHSFSLGWGDDTFIEASFESVPTSIGSPRGWEGMHVFGQDPREPEAHSPSLVSYLWHPEDPESRIQPGQSLSGFSVQLPAPRTNHPPGRPPPYPDLTDVPFTADLVGARCPVKGTVESD